MDCRVTLQVFKDLTPGLMCSHSFIGSISVSETRSDSLMDVVVVTLSCVADRHTAARSGESESACEMVRLEGVLREGKGWG